MEPLPPPLPAPESSFDLPGFTLGHGTDVAGMTGVTVILCPEGALAAAEVRGSATGTRQFDSLVLGHHVASRAHAVVLAGGSAFGLAAAEPVVEWLATRGHGFVVGPDRPGGPAVVPLVPTAILFDLGFGDPQARPAAALAEEALTAAGDGPVAVGSVGAGTGATVGKARGLDCAMKGGFGFASLHVPGGPTVAVAVAVNAFGDVRDPFAAAAARGPDGLLAACRAAPDSLRLVGAERTLAALPADAAHPWEGNTTLAVVMTDAVLSKAAALKVCQMAFGGLYRTLAPALSLYDGDLVVTLSSGAIRAHVNQVGVLAEHAVAQAILTAVRAADGFGLLPAVRDLAAGDGRWSPRPPA
ncbi:MAG TPA: P1 family peptidase [Thermoanaerobaculia bacterium]|nr:P1 family peptidase [Thermoanaerobaculia bacterium]